MNSKHTTCPHAASGCNWPEGDCLDLCTPVQMLDDLPADCTSCECNEIPAPTSPIGGWGSVIRIFNRHAEK